MVKNKAHNGSLINPEEIIDVEELPLEVLDFTEADITRVKPYFTDQGFICLQQSGIHVAN